MDELLDHLLTSSASPEPVSDIAQWLPRHDAVTARFADPVERAMAGGFAADRPGYGFVSGLLEALRRLVPSTAGATSALCATEAEGAHPRAIRTHLTQVGGRWRLNGDKRFATLAPLADQLLVITSQGHDADGRNRLAVVNVPARRRGITISELPATSFAPEVPHAAIRFDEVEVTTDDLLPGDGYADFLKPFRTIEDVHVTAALLGWSLQVGRRNRWPHHRIEAIIGALAAARTIAATDPVRPASHLALAGFLERAATLFAEADWDHTDPTTRRRWLRDRPLLEVAATVRARRRDRAWEVLGER